MAKDADTEMNDRPAEDSATYRKSTLSNGVRILTDFVPNVRSASIGLWVGVGSSHEVAPLRGISHCIEHMLFKGTRTRSERRIAEEMDSIGGHLNAFTDKEATCYHARVVDEHVRFSFELLADMFLNSTFDPEELRKEQKVILEEIKMYDDSPEEVSHDLFIRSVWAGSPLGDPTIGYAETVSAVTRESIYEFMADTYAPDNVVVTAAGNVNHEAVTDEVRRLFGDLRTGERAKDPAPPQFRPTTEIKQEDSEQVYVIVGAEGVSASDERRYAYSLLDTILGGGMASRLFHEIRSKRGLAYNVYSAHHSYRSGGLLTIAAATGPKTAREVITIIRAELAQLVSDGVTDDEVARAKEHIKGGLLLSLESTSTRMLRLGHSEINVGRYVPPSEIVARIEAVTKADVDALSRALFVPARTALTVLGPIDEQFGVEFAGSLAQTA